MTRQHSSGLRWVSVQGRPAHVSWYAHLAPRRRPEAHCPHCGTRLTLKLGTTLRHHAAHAPASRCAMTRPETALHSDVKHHIAAQLQRAREGERRIVIRRRCAGVDGDACQRIREETWCADWDAVKVEAGLPLLDVPDAARRRPDVLLYRGGDAIAAIEVLVSHAAAAHSGVPYVEVRAHESLIDGDDAWHAGLPLPVERAGAPGAGGVEPEVWRCEEHAQAHARLDASRARRLAEDADSDRVRTRLLGARVVDVYHPDGSRERVVYRLEEQVDRDGHWLVLKRGTREVAGGREPFSPDDHDSFRLAWRDLRERAAADVEALTPSGAFRDSPMRWATHDVAANLVYEGLYDVVPGDAAPLATRYPRRWFYVRAEGRWFLPPEMRDVRWDREAGDPFAAHPAWTASRAAVRERVTPAAREDAWRSFVFAGRPRAEDFGRGTGESHADGAITLLRLAARGRALVVQARDVSDGAVRDLERRLTSEGVEHVWLSHPRDWNAARADLPWAPAGRDARGKGVVLVDGVGVYTAERFARGFAERNARLDPEALRLASANRVRHLRR